jgi:hypothetical protein
MSNKKEEKLFSFVIQQNQVIFADKISEADKKKGKYCT